MKHKDTSDAENLSNDDNTKTLSSEKSITVPQEGSESTLLFSAAGSSTTATTAQSKSKDSSVALLDLRVFKTEPCTREGRHN